MTISTKTPNRLKKRQAVITRTDPWYKAEKPYFVTVYFVNENGSRTIAQIHTFKDYEEAFEFADFIADGNVDDYDALGIARPTA